MYGKIFSSIYDGTLYGQWEAIVTFQQMIVLADSVGVVDMTPPALSARTSIPLEIIATGLKTLAQPDPYSRTPDNEGRRIELIDETRPWGWRIINYEYYRSLASREDKREKDRLRIAEKRDKSRVSQDVARCRAQSPMSHTETDTQTDTDTQKEKREDAARPALPRKRFEKPSIAEISQYCKDIGSGVNPATFFNHYETVGWKVGKNPMKDWKAAVRGWTSRDNT